MMDWSEFQKWCAALCMWREARDQGHDGLRAVCHVIANRAIAKQKSWAEIVYQRLQFSSMTYPQDPQLTRVPMEPDHVFEECYNIADTIFGGGDFDLTQGADHYFADTIEPPSWAANMTFLVKIGHHSFYKE